MPGIVLSLVGAAVSEAHSSRSLHFHGRQRMSNYTTVMIVTKTRQTKETAMAAKGGVGAVLG